MLMYIQLDNNINIYFIYKIDKKHISIVIILQHLHHQIHPLKFFIKFLIFIKSLQFHLLQILILFSFHLLYPFFSRLTILIQMEFTFYSYYRKL